MPTTCTPKGQTLCSSTHTQRTPDGRVSADRELGRAVRFGSNDLVTFLPGSCYCQMAGWLAGSPTARIPRPWERLCSLVVPKLPLHPRPYCPGGVLLHWALAIAFVNSNQVPGMPSHLAREWHRPCPVNQADAHSPLPRFPSQSTSGSRTTLARGGCWLLGRCAPLAVDGPVSRLP